MGAIAALLAVATFARFSVVPTTHRAVFEAVGPVYGVSPNLLHAIAWHESNLQADAISPPNRNGTRDWGLMQINEVNFGLLQVAPGSVLQPFPNVSAGARLLGQLQAVNGSVLDVLSVYNAGAPGGSIGTPKRSAGGGYVNGGYVAAVSARLALVTLAYPLGVV